MTNRFRILLPIDLEKLIQMQMRRRDEEGQPFRRVPIERSGVPSA